MSIFKQATKVIIIFALLASLVGCPVSAVKELSISNDGSTTADIWTSLSGNWQTILANKNLSIEFDTALQNSVDIAVRCTYIETTQNGYKKVLSKEGEAKLSAQVVWNKNLNIFASCGVNGPVINN